MEEATLLFRHLPAELNIEERKDLLYYLGASHVKVMSKTGHMKNTAFAVFGSKDQATQVLNQLHQIEFLGSRLVVEFAKTQLPLSDISGKESHPKDKDSGTNDEESVLIKREDDQQIEPQEIKFDATFGTWGLKHLRRPELRYAYPPPTPSILTNILNALAAVPKFYVQVLHLMNKMDLPAPFGAVTPAPPIRPDIREPTLPDDTDQLEMDISSETESELESGEENVDKKRVKEVRPKKRLPKAVKRHSVKRPRLSDLKDSGTSITPSTTALPVSQVFEMLNEAHGGAKKIELRLPSTILSDSQHATRQMPMLNTFSVPQPISQYNPVSAAGLSHQMQSMLQQTTPVTQSHQMQSLLQQIAPVTQSHQMQSMLQQIAPVTQSYQMQSMLQQIAPVTQSHQMQSVLQQTAPVTQSYQTSVVPPSYFQAEQHRPPHIPTSYQEQLPSTADLTNLEAQTKPNEQDFEQEVSGAGGFGILQPARKEEKNEVEEDSTSKEWSKGKFISSTEMRRSRLSRSEMKDLSVFKGYREGEPSCRLYIKNLAKNVTEEDIHWIYGRYVDWENELAVNIFDITLMKEGRMKGQAFVTLPTEENAISAVKDTNGFILKDKPLVVQFARSAKVKK